MNDKWNMVRLLINTVVCVARLIRSNIMQDLDIIVRHPTWGGLVTVDTEANLCGWISAVLTYAM